jgi:hypothetical protein
MDDVLSLLAVSVGLLIVWWLCGPVSETPTTVCWKLREKASI